MIKKVLVFLLCLLSFGCIAKTNNTKDNNVITYFKYSYCGGEGILYTYEIQKTENKILFTKSLFIGKEYKYEKEINKNILDNIKTIISDYEVFKWNGFDKSDDRIMDRDDFNLNVTHEDGTIIKANGYMKYPDGYDYSSKFLIDYLESIN